MLLANETGVKGRSGKSLVKRQVAWGRGMDGHGQAVQWGPRDLPVGPVGEGGGASKVLSAVVGTYKPLNKWLLFTGIINRWLLSNTKGTGLRRSRELIHMAALLALLLLTGILKGVGACGPDGGFRSQRL